MKTQVNFRIEPALLKRLKAEAKRSQRSLAVVSGAIIGAFLDNWPVENRDRLYNSLAPKRQGRKLV